MRKLKIFLALARTFLPSWAQRLAYLGRLPEVDGRRIDPSAQAVSDLVLLLRGNAAPPTLEESRRQLSAMAEKFDEPCPSNVTITDITLTGADGQRAARVYEGPESRRTLLYFHGGGWVQGSLDTHNGLCGKLALWGGVKVISYDYRLAPEHKFPAGADDVLAVYKALLEEQEPDQLIVGGDSAGANLCAALMHDLVEEGLPRPRGQLLIYPATDARMITRSHEALAEQVLLPRERIEFFLDLYLPEGQDRLIPRLSPLFSPHLADQPPALIIAGGHDPLWDDALIYAQALEAAGNQVQLEKFKGQIHAFCSITKVIPEGNEALRRSANWIKSLT